MLKKNKSHISKAKANDEGGNFLKVKVSLKNLIKKLDKMPQRTRVTILIGIAAGIVFVVFLAWALTSGLLAPKAEVATMDNIATGGYKDSSGISHTIQSNLVSLPIITESSMDNIATGGYKDSSGISHTIQSNLVSLPVISEPQPTCIKANPTITVSPSNGPDVPAGTPVVYNVSVKNNNNTYCSSVTYNLSRTIPAGWTASYNINSLNLASQTSGSATLTVTSASGAGAGNYSITAIATDSQQNQYTSQTTVYYNVVSVSSQWTFTLKTNKQAYTKNDTIVAIATLLSWGEPNSETPVDFVLTKPNGDKLYYHVNSTDANGQAIWKVGTRNLVRKGGYVTIRATAVHDGVLVGDASVRVYISN